MAVDVLTPPPFAFPRLTSSSFPSTIQNVTGETLSVNNVMNLASNMGELTRVEQQLAANEVSLFPTFSFSFTSRSTT